MVISIAQLKLADIALIILASLHLPFSLVLIAELVSVPFLHNTPLLSVRTWVYESVTLLTLVCSGGTACDAEGGAAARGAAGDAEGRGASRDAEGRGAEGSAAARGAEGGATRGAAGCGAACGGGG